MEEKNELNDIILKKSGAGSNTKKLLLAIAALTLILIIVLVIMNSLKSQSDEQAPNAAIIPEPSSPTEVIDDPLFEPVEVIQEGANNSASPDLGEIAQKIKEESFQNAPTMDTTVVQSSVTPTATQQSLPITQSKPVTQKSQSMDTTIPSTQTKNVPTKVVAVSTKTQPIPKTAQPVVNTPSIKIAKAIEAKPIATSSKSTIAEQKVNTPIKATVAPVQKIVEKPLEKSAVKPVEKTISASGIYYIQVGSFSKQPDQAFFDRINASGLKYTTIPNGAMTKIMIGPFQGEKAARDVLGNVKRNIESGAYITKG